MPWHEVDRDVDLRHAKLRSRGIAGGDLATAAIQVSIVCAHRRLGRLVAMRRGMTFGCEHRGGVHVGGPVRPFDRILAIDGGR